MSDLEIATATHNWFSDQGVLDDYVGVWNLDGVTVNGAFLDLVIYSWWSTFVVPLLVVDEIVILDTKALNRIIEPAIQEINGWSRYNWISGKSHLGNDWDSWFLNRSESFKWNGGSIHQGANINYIVGGHAFAHYYFSAEEMVSWVIYWKYREYDRLPDDPAMMPVAYWLFQGFNGYPGRNRW